jgi:hypothetical protein
MQAAAITSDYAAARDAELAALEQQLEVEEAAAAAARDEAAADKCGVVVLSHSNRARLHVALRCCAVPAAASVSAGLLIMYCLLHLPLAAVDAFLT